MIDRGTSVFLLDFHSFSIHFLLFPPLVNGATRVNLTMGGFRGRNNEYLMNI